MTPREKATELVDKFYQTTPNESWINEPLGIAKEYKAWNQSKECALIAVDEILKENLELPDEPETVIRYLFWQKVKNEIQEL